MELKIRTALTPLDLCTLIAHETVSFLNTHPGALEIAAKLREGLAVLAAAKELTDDVGDLLTWIDREVEIAKPFTATGTNTTHLIDPDSLLTKPDAAAQLDMIWILFKAAVDQPQEQRRVLLYTARTLTQLDGLDYMLLTASTPATGSLTAEDLRTELEDVRTALQAGTMTE